jgi:RNA polymerase II subunit A small phosphatase-like protein
MSSSVAPINKMNTSKSFNPNKFLPVKAKEHLKKKTLILDLDETLVHSSFKPITQKSDILLHIELEGKVHVIHVLKRPGVEEYLKEMNKHYEVVIFTASLSAVKLNINYLIYFSMLIL